MPLTPRATVPRFQRRIFVTHGMGSRAFETCTPERLRLDVLFYFPQTNELGQQQHAAANAGRASSLHFRATGPAWLRLAFGINLHVPRLWETSTPTTHLKGRVSR